MIPWDKKPFYGGTYFPARDGDRGTSMGFLTLLKRLHAAYQKDRQTIEKAGHQITALLQKTSGNMDGNTFPTKELISKAIKSYQNGFDWKNGGLMGQTKFPGSENP